MREVTATITQRGQVTIPAEVRRVLGVRPRDKVTFTIDGDEVRIASTLFDLESAFGSVIAPERPMKIEELSRLAKDEKAAETVMILDET